MNSNDRIREATESDISVLCTLMEELSGSSLTEEEMRNRMKMIQDSRTDSLYVYEEDGEVRGTLGFRVKENIREISRYGEICIVIVKSEHKRFGIGKRLMAYGEQLAQQLGCKAAYLNSGFGRAEEAHLFYKALGYEITGYRFVKTLERIDPNDSITL
ncbi:GNAT family N-acetyltransferase [Paenibacillus kobensis]|uniref:GNAT family N-acetyltransferase n=1 Tax=Paenibacillus kobensis TaxID=59841 RepID=UPI000FD865D8|nr:GNAT family N-acetyltransferase [Paenibacillus kobensis]